MADKVKTIVSSVEGRESRLTAPSMYLAELYKWFFELPGIYQEDAPSFFGEMMDILYEAYEQ